MSVFLRERIYKVSCGYGEITIFCASEVSLAHHLVILEFVLIQKFEVEFTPFYCAVPDSEKEIPSLE
jgi:hypothetical protein